MGRRKKHSILLSSVQSSRRPHKRMRFLTYDGITSLYYNVLQQLSIIRFWLCKYCYISTFQNQETNDVKIYRRITCFTKMYTIFTYVFTEYFVFPCILHFFNANHVSLILFVVTISRNLLCKAFTYQSDNFSSFFGF